MKKWIAILLCTALLLTALTIAVLAAAAELPQSSTEPSRSALSEEPVRTDTPVTEQTTEYCDGEDVFDVSTVCSSVGASANAALVRLPDGDATPTVQTVSDAEHGAWCYYQTIEAVLTYGADTADVCWLDAVQYGTTPKDGFYLTGGQLHLVRDGRFILYGSGSFDGISYTCEDGICTADAALLRLADGGICVMRDDGTPWLDKGFFEYDGGLYYGQADGTLLRNGKYQTMQFDKNGRYTSGSKTIDAFVDAVIASVTEDSMTQEQKLKACYDYVSSSLIYQPNNRHVPYGAAESTWTEEYMLRLIERGRGNCYSFASEMYYLARRLGCWQARAISGRDAPDGYRVDHGWVELDFGEDKYILDPEMNCTRCMAAYALFMIPYSETPWTYYPFYP